MKKTYYIRDEAGQQFAHSLTRLDNPELAAPDLDSEVELDLRAEQAKAMIAAGWIEEVPEKKAKGGKD